MQVGDDIEKIVGLPCDDGYLALDRSTPGVESITVRTLEGPVKSYAVAEVRWSSGARGYYPIHNLELVQLAPAGGA